MPDRSSTAKLSARSGGRGGASELDAFEKSVLVGLLPQPDDATKKQFQVQTPPALVSMFAVPNPNAKSKQEELQFQLAHFEQLAQPKLHRSKV